MPHADLDTTPLHVLIVDDSDDDAILLVRALQAGGYASSWRRVDTADAMRAALDQQVWDLVLPDYFMPRFSGPAALRLLNERRLVVPLIIVSGRVGDEIAIEMLRAGAADYVRKDQLSRLAPSVRRALHKKHALSLRSAQKSPMTPAIPARPRRFTAGISFRLLGGLAGIALLLSLVGLYSAYTHFQAAHPRAIAEAEEVADAMGSAIIELDELIGQSEAYLDEPENIQEFVTNDQLRSWHLTVVNSQRIIIADPDPANTGTTFNRDPGQAVLQTLTDGAPRAFVRAGLGHDPDARLIVVPLRTPSGETMGALVLDYTPLYNANLARAVNEMRELGGLSLASLALALGLGYLTARSVLRPVQRLKQAARQLGEGRLDLPISIESSDEMGELAANFEEMRKSLNTAQEVQLRQIAEFEEADEALQKAHVKLSQWVTELERHTAEIRLLNEMSGMLQMCASLDEAFDMLRRFVPQLFPLDSGTLCLVSASRKYVEAVLAWGPESTESKQNVFTLDECWALRRGQAYIVADLRQAPLCAHAVAATAQASMCLPMMAQGEALGVLHLRYISPNDRLDSQAGSRLQLATAVADQVAMAVANLKLREVLREQSVRDPLTGLFNRRYLEESLERELAQAKRQSAPLAVCMLDVDHFKNFNDRFGHEAGDLVLRELGRLLQAQVRAGDLACRLGGEEFALVMPDLPLEAASQRAHQLCSASEQLQVSLRGQLLGQITLSVGVASFPAHGDTGPTLLHAADEALYRAKQLGRNRVVIAQT